MSSCFYTKLIGGQAGIDVHDSYPMVALAGWYAIWPHTFWKTTGRVSADCFGMIQQGFELYLVQHLPTSVDPKALATAVVATAGSGSTPFLCKQNVTGERSPLACCVQSFVGLNVDCWSEGVIKSAPSAELVSVSSVVTTPTASDWASATFRLLWSNLMSNLLGKAFGNAGKLEEGMDPWKWAFRDQLPIVLVKHLQRRAPEIFKALESVVGPNIAPILLWPMLPWAIGSKKGEEALTDGVKRLLDVPTAEASKNPTKGRKSNVPT
jgi:hypothetical protein